MDSEKINKSVSEVKSKLWCICALHNGKIKIACLSSNLTCSSHDEKLKIEAAAEMRPAH